MKRFIPLAIFVFAITTGVNGQRHAFYVDGYLLQNKDTTWCKIWFNPDTPYFKNEITIWVNEETKMISLEKNDALDGFGITQQGHQIDFGKIRVQGHNSWIFIYTQKLVSGVVELYELPFTEIKKDPGSFKLIREEFAAYYIGRTDNNSSTFPTQLKQLKKKKIAPFLKDFPGLEEITDDIMTAGEVTALLKRYNEWFKKKST